MTVPPILRAGRGAPLVFLHGLGGAARLWRPQIYRFGRRGHDAIAFDLPGRSDDPLDRGVTIAGLTDDVREVLARLGVDQPVLVGHSLGGMIVQTLLRRDPDCARAAVLFAAGPAFRDPNGEFRKAFLDPLGPPGENRSTVETTSAMVARMVGPDADPAGVALAAQCLAATPPARLRAVANCLVGFDERTNLTKIRVPVLVLVGGRDPTTSPAMLKRMAGKIRDAQFLVMPGAGHFANVERPTAFNKAVEAFLASALPAGRR